MLNRIPVLACVDMVLTRTVAPATDLTQVCCPFAYVYAHAQGATFSGTSQLALPGSGAETVVPVYHPGAIAVGDKVLIYNQVLEAGQTFVVTAVAQTPSASVKVRNDSAAWTVPVGARLLALLPDGNPALKLFSDPTGQTAGADYIRSTDTGRFTTYVKEYRFDLRILGIPGEVARVYADCVGSFVMR